MSLPRFCNAYQGSRGHAAGLLFTIADVINRALERETRVIIVPRKEAILW